MDEILVHITAPTTRKNDEVYRALADAYHDFVPVGEASSLKSHRGKPTSNVLSMHRSDRPQVHPSPNAKASTAQTNINTPSFATKDSYGSFPSQVASRPPHGLYHEAQDSFRFSDDMLRRSGRLAQLERMQRSWRSSHPPISSGSELQSSGGSPLLDLDKQDFMEDTQLAAQAAQSQLPDDIPYFSSTSEDTPEDEHEDAVQNGTKPDDILEDGPNGVRRSTTKVADTFENGLEDLPQGTAPPPPTQSEVGSRQQSTFFEDVPSPTLVTSRTSASQRSKAIASLESDASSSGEPIDFSQLPSEVLPPPPSISVDASRRLPSQLTTYLAAVKRQNKDCFKPTRKSRALDADERGCWLVETSQWSKTSQSTFWTSLCEHVRQGRLGWGVFLYRESQNDGCATGLGPVRLYCWGEIVEEVWLVMWLCSVRRISGSGSRWLDAEEAVVIQCP